MGVRSFARGIAAALAVAGLPPVAGAEPDAPRLSVLLITVDTLRADRLSLAGYPRKTTPNVDAFFRGGEVYLRAYSAEANTGPSVVSILTGLYPSRHGVRLLYQRIGDDVPTLADHLRKHGYQTAAVVSNVVLTGEAVGLDRRFEHYDDRLDERTNRDHVYERRADATTDAALAWLERERDEDRPHLLWVHYIDPHGPYDPPEERPRDFSHARPVPLGDGAIQRYQRIEGVRDSLEYVDRYDEEIAFTDVHVGRLLRRYSELGLTDESVVVFTADHGETMTEHQRYFTHGYHVWEPIMRVPLAVRHPRRLPRRSGVPVSLVDLVPTLLRDLEIDVPVRLDGQPLGTRAPDSTILLQASGATMRQRALVTAHEKWFATIGADGRILDRWTLDLTPHPERRKGARWEPSAEGESFLARVRSDRPPSAGASERSAPGVAAGRSASQLRALRALGYVE